MEFCDRIYCIEMGFIDRSFNKISSVFKNNIYYTGINKYIKYILTYTVLK